MKKATVNDYFRHHWVKLMLFALFTAAVSFFAPLKNFQLKWLIDSKSKQEALGYMGLVFLITFTSWFLSFSWRFMGSTRAWLPSRRSTEHQMGALVMTLSGQVRPTIF